MKFDLYIYRCLWIGLGVSACDELTKHTIFQASHDGWEKLAQRRGDRGKGDGRGGKGGARLPPPPKPPPKARPPQPPPPPKIPPKARPVLPGKGRPDRPVPTSSVDTEEKRKMSFKDVAAREVKKRKTTVKMVPGLPRYSVFPKMLMMLMMLMMLCRI